MTTRYEFGYGYGDIYRRRMHAQKQMHQRFERDVTRLPEEEQAGVRYASDYYGFRGAGRRGSYETEFRVQPQGRPRGQSPRSIVVPRGSESRRRGPC